MRTPVHYCIESENQHRTRNCQVRSTYKTVLTYQVDLQFDITFIGYIVLVRLARLLLNVCKISLQIENILFRLTNRRLSVEQQDEVRFDILIFNSDSTLPLPLMWQESDEN